MTRADALDIAADLGIQTVEIGGADPIAAITALRGAIHHVHVKDTRIEDRAAVMSRQPLPPSAPGLHRAWVRPTRSRYRRGSSIAKCCYHVDNGCHEEDEPQESKAPYCIDETAVGRGSAGRGSAGRRIQLSITQILWTVINREYLPRTIYGKACPAATSYQQDSRVRSPPVRSPPVRLKVNYPVLVKDVRAADESLASVDLVNGRRCLIWHYVARLAVSLLAINGEAVPLLTLPSLSAALAANGADDLRRQIRLADVG
jgi:hypothetical protein